MPRIAIVSDTHFERNPPPKIDRGALPEFDLLVHAGDLAERDLPRALDWLGDVADGRPAIWCPGNHDLYGVGTGWAKASMIDRVSEVASEAGQRGIATLAPTPGSVSGFVGGIASLTPCGCYDLPGVTIVGSTLWTDWRLAGLWTIMDPEDQDDLDEAAYRMLPRVRPHHSPDFAHLKDRFGRDWNPRTIACEHAIHLDAIDRALAGLVPRAAGGRDQATVVVTHHAPHARSVGGYLDKPLPDWAPGFYASHLPWMLGRHRIDVWVHGHIHVPVDYEAGNTRIVSNPCPNAFELRILEV
jgi:3',5'-cyclic AMP phosphodiesterase CpdA